MTAPLKRIRLTHSPNVRDLGGYETSEGKATAFKKLLRGGALNRLTPEEWERLKEWGLCTVLDLRSQAEIDMAPDRVPEGVLWLHCPLQTEQIDASDISGSARRAFTDSLTEGYLNIVRNNGHLLSKALLALIDGLDRGGVLFHCTAGKDRTGVLASAVYYLCGVDREDIVADYQVTYTYNQHSMREFLQKTDEKIGAEMLPFMKSDPDAMERLVSFYEEIHLLEYLREYHMTEQAVLRLKTHFLL